MTRVYIVLAIYLLSPVLIVCAFQKWSLVRKVGTVLIAYAVGIIMALSGLVSFAPDTAEAAMFGKIQNWIMNIAVPLAIPLMLFNCDFKMWTKALPKTIYSLLGGILAMLIAVVSGYFVFRSQNIPQFPQVAAMMTGIYTGGTMNFNALGASLGVQGTTMAVVLAFEMVLTTPYILFIIAGGYKIFRKALPYTDETSGTAADTEHSAKVADVEDYSGMFRKKKRYRYIVRFGSVVVIFGGRRRFVAIDNRRIERTDSDSDHYHIGYHRLFFEKSASVAQDV